MTGAVLDASVVVKWFRAEGEAGSDEARSLRASFEAGELRAVVPSLLWLELLNVAARRWKWTRADLQELAGRLGELGFDVREPPLEGVARWAAAGLTAYDAAYVALAEAEGIVLVTDDQAILGAAPNVAAALGDGRTRR